MAELTERPVIGVTVGDPAGIGPEVVIKALCEPTLYNDVKPLVFADRSVLEQTVKSFLSIFLIYHHNLQGHRDDKTQDAGCGYGFARCKQSAQRAL